MKKSLIALFLATLFIFQWLPATVYASTDPTDTTQLTDVTNSTESTDTAPSEPDALTPDVSNSNAGIDAGCALVSPGTQDFDATAVLLYEINSDTMVYAKDIDQLRYPASLTKVMTCLLALEHGDLTAQVTVSEEALADRDPSGSSSGLQVGEVLTLEQLLYCLMIASGNDAAPVIAEHIAGSEAAFLEMMNEKARELGCSSTHFVNTHGLHHDDHYTTARDMAKIMLAALEYDTFQEIYSTARYVLPETNLQKERILVTTNYLIGTTVVSSYYDSRVIGGKTGFTTPAGRCVICTAEKGNLLYLCVIMGASNTKTEDGIIYGSFVTASQVLDLGFNNFTFAEVLSPLSPVAQLPVDGATESVVLTPGSSVTTMLPKEYDPAQLRIDYTLEPSNVLTAPLEANQDVGKVDIYYGSICVGSTDLVTVTAVQRNALASATKQTLEEFEQSPWKTVIIILTIVLVLIAGYCILYAWIRAQNRKRRQERRRRL